MNSPSPFLILRVHVVISLAVTLALLAIDQQHALSYAVGSGLMGLNFGLLIIGWGGLLGKKSIALPVGIIVIKWTLFGAICVYLARSNWIVPIPFVLGIGSIVISALSIVVKRKITSKA